MPWKNWWAEWLPGVRVGSAAQRVLYMSMAMVMGPTPPGTGVMAAARAWALGKSTSPAEFVIIATIDTDVDDYCAWLEPFAFDGAAAADGGDDDVGGSAELGEVGAARVGDGGGAVGVEQ